MPCIIVVPSAQIQSEEPGGNTFHLGFSECASEVSKFLTGLPNLEPDVHAKLLDHLSRCITVSKDTGYTLNASAQSTSTKSMTYSMQGSGHQSLNTPVSTVCSVAGRSERSIVRQETFLQRNRDIPYRDLHARPSSYESNNQKYVLASEMCKTQAMPIQLVDNVNTDNTKRDVRRANQSMPSIPLTMNQSPAISVGNVINGLQLVPIQFQNGDIAYAIPTNILSSAVIPSCVLSLVSPNSLSQTAINPSPKSLSSSNAEQKGLQSLSSNDCHYDPRTVRTEGQNCDQPHGLLESQRPDKPVPLISESLDRSTRVPIISRSSSSDTARLPIISCSQDTVNLTVMSPLESRSVVAPIIIPRSLDSVSNNVNNILPQRGDDSDEVWRPW